MDGPYQDYTSYYANYIQEWLNQGYTLYQVRAYMIQSGHDPATVDAAIQSLQYQATHEEAVAAPAEAVAAEEVAASSLPVLLSMIVVLVLGVTLIGYQGGYLDGLTETSGGEGATPTSVPWETLMNGTEPAPAVDEGPTPAPTAGPTVTDIGPTPTSTPTGTPAPGRTDCSLIGSWVQTGHTDLEGRDMPSPSPLTYAMVVLTYTGGGTGTFGCRGSFCNRDEAFTGKVVGGNQLCMEIGGKETCVPFTFIDCDSLYYCSADDETLEEGEPPCAKLERGEVPPAATPGPTADPNPLGCSLDGMWKQTGCATSANEALPCMIPVTQYARMLTFTGDTVNSNCEGETPYCDGQPLKPSKVKGNKICIDMPKPDEGELPAEGLCFPVIFTDCDTIIYCLAPPTVQPMPEGIKYPCEKLVRVG
ncbi:MAG: hypothetical protein QF415_04675 [Candidatus Undinarchaeales archaeon]|nr:hypothetical protein [Candidatus Undinarchaeales archaeon]MDP7493309.1 hypothetical protein [Candidatus Undinarchaeales archaeon]